MFERSRRVLSLLLLTFAALALRAQQPALRLAAPETVADGVALYRLDDPALLDPPGPVRVAVLRLDPRRVRLAAALAQDRVLGTEDVAGIAARHGAVAAINAGFFEATGEPAGLLKVDGELVSDTALPRGAVAIGRASGNAPIRLLFDRVTVSVRLRFREGRARHDVPVNGVDTVRAPGRLVLYTPRFGSRTGPVAPDASAVEWVLQGTPLKVVERHDGAGDRTIARDGAVLSFGGRAPPAPLDRLAEGAIVEIAHEYRTSFGTDPRDWARAPYIVGGAGLLARRDRPIQQRRPERLRPGFDVERHPRTIIGVDERGAIWLVAVDGRNPQWSLGMSFGELQRLAESLGLRDALNLDGGGSTTMVVRGVVVNRPSDPTGPRRVSDALLVFTRP